MEKLYGAMDLHSNNSFTVLTNEKDQVVYQKRLPNDLSYIVQQLEPYRPMIQGIVVESTYNWYWLVDGLMAADYRMHLANTAAIQQYSGLKYTDDPSDDSILNDGRNYSFMIVRSPNASEISELIFIYILFSETNLQ